MASRKKRWLLLFLALLACLPGGWMYVEMWTTPRQLSLPVERNSAPLPRPKLPLRQLRVLSLNLAHGRGRSLNQIFVSTQRIRAMLRRIAGLLRKMEADVVALQEADGRCWWSGSFHHVRFLAKEAGYPYMAFAPLIDVTGLQYGTALLSRIPLSQARQLRFAHGFPMIGKGAVIATLQLPKPIDVASIHLDPPRSSVRQKQLNELRRFLQRRDRPAILAGDFNTGWLAGRKELSRFAAAHKLKAYRPKDPDLTSFPFLKKRLDWILVPRPFAFVAYRHLNDAVSDHLPIFARIRLPRERAPGTR